MKRNLLISLLISMLVPATLSAAYVNKVVITTAEPVVGQKHSFKATVPETASTEVYEVHWEGEFDNGKFIQGKDYTITVKLRIKATSSNTFATSSSINATINGNKAKVTSTSDVIQSKTHTITVKYTWKTLGGENPNDPKTKLKSKLAGLAAEYKATNTTNYREILNYVRAELKGAEVWSTGGVHVSTKRVPTETNDGSISVPMGITYGGVTLDNYTFTVVLPALAKSPDAANLSADMALMKEALRNFSTTSKTTGNDVLAAVNRAATHGTKAAWDKNYRYQAPTEKYQGSIEGNIIISLGGQKDIIQVYKSLPIDGSAADAHLDADVSAVSKALYNYGVTNSTTQEELVDAAKAAIKNGSKLTLAGFAKRDATFDKEGKIEIGFNMELKGKTRTPRITIRMSKLRAKLPVDIFVSQYEWEVLRLTNIERYKVGSQLLVMVAPLQKAADIRSKEIVTDYRYDHLRPDGSKFSTAIDPAFVKNRTCGENAFRGELTPSQAIEGWMNSPGHKANILKAEYCYFGAGAHIVRTWKYWIQLFATGGGIHRVESSTGSYNFNSVADMEKAYLICHTSDGIMGYVPFDTDYMVRNGNQYTIHLKGQSVTVTVEKH